MACKFKTIYNPPEMQVCEPGRGMSNVYGISIDKDSGHQKLIKTGETNTYEIIQAHYEQTKIENIMARATLDPSVLMQKVGEYGDYTETPTSLLDAQIKIMGIKNEFEKLPNEVRQKFNYSLGEYVAEYGGEKWAKALGLTNEETNNLNNAAAEVIEKVEEEQTND